MGRAHHINSLAGWPVSSMYNIGVSKAELLLHWNFLDLIDNTPFTADDFAQDMFNEQMPVAAMAALRPTALVPSELCCEQRSISKLNASER